MSVITTSKVVGAPAECVVARERHLQHRQAVAARLARDGGQHLALSALKHRGPGRRRASAQRVVDQLDRRLRGSPSWA